ncbi:MAG: endonuclease domain-containing protein [Roseivirga sp.]|nr:endonuclease domain-containing protein [Roseivirga sp.]
MHKNRNHNLKHLKETRRQLRNNGTSAEATLWRSIQKSQLKGRKFRRQHSVDNHILDFYCPSEKLAIELDGDHHFSSSEWLYDKKRDDRLRDQGITVLRFENDEVFHALEALLEKVTDHFKED